MICERGGAVLTAGQLAKGNRDKANRIYTAALASAVLVANPVERYAYGIGTAHSDAGRRALFEQSVGQRCFHRSECGATFSQRSERANDDM